VPRHCPWRALVARLKRAEDVPSAMRLGIEGHVEPKS
jgi:hypothetical protein